MIARMKIKPVMVLLLSMISIALTFRTINTLSITYHKRPSEKILQQEEKSIKVGFSLGTLKEERWIKDRDILMAKVKELGADIIVLNANNDDQDQFKQVKYLIEQNIDVLIIVPNDYQRAAAAVELAKKQGIKVISYDRLVLNANVDLYISFDNMKVGELMGAYILDKIPQGNLLIVNGPTSDYNTKLLKEGYEKVLGEELAEGSIHIIGEERAPNWMKEYAFRIVDELLQNEKVIDGIIAGNDGLAEGAIEALSQYRLAGETMVVGQDGDLAACQRIVEGTQLMTVYKPIEKLTDAAARMAVQLARGETLNNIKNSIYDGSYEVPYYVVQPIAVDKSNLESTIIKDGFHRRDEVYRNSP